MSKFANALKIVVVALVALMAGSGMAAADDALFVIHSKDGKVTLDVTDAVIAKVGVHVTRRCFRPATARS